MSVPRVATYRVQLRPGFGFDDARSLVDYWAELGISHLYASPYLQAAKGSAHGYDVVDSGRVNEELGGEPGRAALAAALAGKGMGQLLDIVPNHMAIRGGHNAWWWDVLENGPASRYSSYFDVEWQAATEDRILLPILGDQYGVELENGCIKLRREGPQFLIEYYEHRNPVAPRSLGPILQQAAALARSDDLGFLADAFSDLPLPSARDRQSRKRRHRDKQILGRTLEHLLSEEPELAIAVDRVIESINEDFDQLHEVLEHQNYRLAHWRVGNHELDYRRFFDIDSLVGLRVEDEEVFDATHRLPLGWVGDGSIDGLRIDHIDGLYDPAGYLERLRTHAPQAWLVVEKILEGDETLPNFPVEGATGYEFLNLVQRLLVDPGGEPALSESYQQVSPHQGGSKELIATCKRLVLEQALGSDLKRLVERLSQISRGKRRYRDFSRFELTEALKEFCVAFPVYRTYVREDDQQVSRTDRDVIQRASAAARAANPNLDARLFEFLERLLLLEWPGAAEREFIMRLQQLTGPTMAKGLEDTAFYRHGRLIALNEVGGDPNHFSESTARYHAWMRERQARQPYALNATSTHDTKRSEDVRARLWVLSEVPEHWREALERWRPRLARYKAASPTAGLELAPEAGMEYMLLQNLIGAWPIEKQRLLDYAKKALREAKLYTSWHRPDEGYESTVFDYIERLYADRELLDEIGGFVASISDAGYANSLSQLVLKVLSPGVPDIYQGTELWDFSLVDPDNRRPVDYAERRRTLELLGQSSPEQLWAERAGGGIKLHFLKQTLALRARQPRSFAADSEYRSIEPRGSHQERVIAFARGDAAVAVVSRWYQKHRLDFGDTEITLPPGTWRNVLTSDKSFTGTVRVVELLTPFPAAALERLPGSEA